MKSPTISVAVIVLLGGISALTIAGEQMKGAKSVKSVKSMSGAEQIKLAQSAAPPYISRDATIMIMEPDGKMTEGKKGTNGFTCFPDVDGQEIPDPICADEAAMKWVNDFMENAPRPTNAVPGIAYMARGGWHWEKDGKIVMDKNTPGAKRVKEPPHWMVFWPFDSKMSGIPTLPGKFGTYVMWDGTPYAHLMIYQDPNTLK